MLALFFDVGSFFYTPIACFLFLWGVSVTHPIQASFLLIWGASLTYPVLVSFFFMWAVSLTHPVLALFLSGEFLLHIPCWLFKNIFLYIFYSGEFLLHILCWLYFYVGSFFYTSIACFLFLWGASVTHPILASFLLIWRASLTHPVLVSFLCGQFLLHIPCRLLYLENFSHTSRAGFIFILVVSLINQVLVLGVFLFCFCFVLFLSEDFLLHIPMLALFFCGKFLVNVPSCLFILFYFLNYLV